MERHQLTQPTGVAVRRGREATSGWLPSLVAASCCFYLVIVAVLAAGVLVPPLVGISATTIVSGSMRPTVNVGDVILSKPANVRDAAELEVGDVVTFRDPGQDRLVTHRIIEVLEDGRFRTRGDANHDPDRLPIGPEHVVGKPTLLLPMAGLPAHWLATGGYAQAAAWLALTGVAVIALRSQRYQPKHRKRPPLVRRLAPTAIAVLAVVAVVYAQRPATAAFTGGTGTGGNAVGAATLDAPTGLSGTPGCTVVVLLPKVTLTWSADVDADGHAVWRSATSGGTPTQIGTATTATFTDSTVSAGSTYYYTVRSTAGSWVSTPSAQVAVSVPLTCL